MKDFENTSIISAKGVMDSKMAALPAAIQQGLAAGVLKVVDSAIYSQKCMKGGSVVELMENSDTAVAGVTNLNNRKMEQVNYFVVTGIRLLSKTVTPSASAITDAEIANADLGIATKEVLNGELEIQVAGKVAFPRNSCRCFAAENDKMGKGYYKLESPFVIAPQSEIVPTLRVNSSFTTTNEVVRVELIGARIINA